MGSFTFGSATVVAVQWELEPEKMQIREWYDCSGWMSRLNHQYCASGEWRLIGPMPMSCPGTPLLDRELKISTDTISASRRATNSAAGLRARWMGPGWDKPVASSGTSVASFHPPLSDNGAEPSRWVFVVANVCTNSIVPAQSGIVSRPALIN